MSVLSQAWPAVRGALLVDGWHAGAGALDSFFGTMPSVAASAGIEVRLGGDPRVDAGAVFARSDLGEADLPEVCAWAGAAAPLVRRWWSGEAPLLWVEADATEAGLKPFGFVTVVPELMNRGAHGDGELVLARAHHFLGAAPLDDIRAAIETLDGAGRLLHVAALPAWRGGGCRLHLELAAAGVVPWLQRVGWGGDLDEVTRCVGRLRRIAWGVGVQVSIHQRGIGPDLGLDVSSDLPPHYTDMWPRLFEAFGTAAVRPDRGEALCRWWGPLAGAPVDLRRRFFVKVAVRPDAPPALKGYLVWRVGAD